jgi:hypothetical protein
MVCLNGSAMRIFLGGDSESWRYDAPNRRYFVA